MSGTEIRTTHVTYDRAGKLDVQCGERGHIQHLCSNSTCSMVGVGSLISPQ
jgi:hypothetical protein